MDYITVQQAAKRWGISDRRVRLLCRQERIEGVIRYDDKYLIPLEAVKPIDGRTQRRAIIPPQYQMAFARIDSLKQELSKRRPLTSGEIERLQEEFVVEYTYNSNAIEGSSLTLQETALVLEGIAVDRKPLSYQLEAIGHRDAYLYVERIVTENVHFSEEVIKNVHALVLMDRPKDKGVYRSLPVRIMGAHVEPPPPVMVEARIRQLLADHQKSRRHPIEKAAIFHLIFEGIHPFIDGNGRTGRLILNMMLMKEGYPAIDIKFADRREYYECFNRYYKDGLSDPMVDMLNEYIHHRLKQYLSIVR